MTSTNTSGDNWDKEMNDAETSPILMSMPSTPPLSKGESSVDAPTLVHAIPTVMREKGSVDAPTLVHKTVGNRSHRSLVNFNRPRPNFFGDLSVERAPTPGSVMLSLQESVPFNTNALDMDSARIATQANLIALRPIPSSSMLDAFSIDEELTWLLPAIHLPEKVQSGEVQTTERQDYASLLSKLVKSSGIYALASFVSPLISLVLAPFLTKNLSSSDYGALAVLNTAIALLVGLTQLGLNHAFFRAYTCDYETKEDRLRVVSTLVALLLLISVPTTLTLCILAPQLSTVLLNSPSYATAIRIAAVIVLMQNLTIPGFSWLRVENRAAIFSMLSILNLLVNLGFNIVLVGMMRWGVAGALIAVGSGYGCITICTLPFVLWRAGFRPRLDIVRNLLSFGIPLVSSFIAVWVLQLSDRYLLSHLGSLEQTGSYSVAYTLGGILGAVVLAPFSLAWPTAMFTIAKRTDAPSLFRIVFRWYSIGLLFTTFVFSLVSTCVLYLFFPPAYHSAASIIPIIAVSIMFYGIYDMFTIGIGVKRKTWFAVLLTGFSGVVNIICNILLIPLYGPIGAALATLIAYLLLAVLTYFVNQHIYPIPFEIGKFTLALIVGVIGYGAAYVLTLHRNIYETGSIFVGTLLIYSVFLVLLGNPFSGIRMVLNKFRKNV